MTEPINEPQPAAADVTDVTAVTAAADTVDDVAEPQTIEAARKLRQENKNLRARLHELEESYGAAAAVVSAMQLQEAERLASSMLHDPTDLWREHDLQSMFDDEFATMIDPNKIVDAAKAVISKAPHLAKPPTAPPPTDRPLEGLRSGGRSSEDKPPAPTWASAIHGTGR